MRFLLIAFGLFICSCSRTLIKSNGKIPISIRPQEYHQTKIEIDHEVPFYLWGSLPYRNTVYLDELLQEKGLRSAANVSITEYLTGWDIFRSIISLGFYTPIHYKINAFGVNSRETDRFLP